MSIDTTFSAKSPRDVSRLAAMLSQAPAAEHSFIAANLMSHGMMRMNWFMHQIVRFSAWRQGVPQSLVWANTFKRAPIVAADLIEQTVEWMLTGKDADGVGCGGFNQVEINKLLGILVAANSEPLA